MVARELISEAIEQGSRKGVNWGGEGGAPPRAEGAWSERGGGASTEGKKGRKRLGAAEGKRGQGGARGRLVGKRETPELWGA